MTEAKNIECPEISVIIPCYGVLWNINNIFNDLINQTYNNFEIIFINDGDSTLSIPLLNLKERDDRVVVLEKKNGGVSSARNAGIKESKGKYIVFIDSDDRIEKNYLKKLHDCVAEGNYDLGIGGFIRYYKQENLKIEQNITIEDFNPDNWRNYYFKLEEGIIKSPWNKIYKSKIIKDNSIFFNEDISYLEDAFFTQAIFMNINKLNIIENCGYIYTLLDKNSLSSKYKKELKDYEIIYINNECELLKNIGLSDVYINNYKISAIGLYCYFLVCNYFKKGSPYTFLQSVKAINENLLSNSYLMEHYNKFKKNKCNNFIKIFHISMKTKSPLLVAFLFKIQYFIKYNFYNLYLYIKPWLRK